MSRTAPTKRTTVVLAGTTVALVAVLVVALLATGVLPTRSTAERGGGDRPVAGGDGGAADEATPEPPADLVRAFLDGYVDPDGRVVRRDEGGDTVSEGQAYGLLLATAAGDEDLVRTIWTWTNENLVGIDGLMAWRWQDGQVVDDNGATDADLDAAWALVVAGDRFDDPQLRAAGLALAQAVLRETTRQVATGRALLAGPWVEGPPWLVNPSYSSPGAVAVLGRATGDPAWAELARTDADVLDELLDSAPLPPDWAQVDDAGAVEIMPPPAGGEVGFGLDAARVPVRLAASCDPEDRERAAALAPVLGGPTPAPGRRDLGGTATVDWVHPLADVAAASALAAAGETGAARNHLDVAARIDARTPTYYGSAWVALADVLLVREDTGLRGCEALLADHDEESE